MSNDNCCCGCALATVATAGALSLRRHCEALVVRDTVCPLQALHTGGNQMGHVGAQHLGQLLSKSTELVAFARGGSSPSPEGATALYQGLLTMTLSCASTQGNRLQHLDLTGCTIFSQHTSLSTYLDNVWTILENSLRLQVLMVRDSGLDGCDRCEWCWSCDARHSTRLSFAQQGDATVTPTVTGGLERIGQ
jgi:hypothetical protein